MSFRFRLGPFTFGRSGVRLSLWRRGTGFSVPLSGKGRAFGKTTVGPVSWYFGRTVLLMAAVVGVLWLLFQLFHG